MLIALLHVAAAQKQQKGTMLAIACPESSTHVIREQRIVAERGAIEVHNVRVG